MSASRPDIGRSAGIAVAPKADIRITLLPKRPRSSIGEAVAEEKTNEQAVMKIR